MEIYEIRQSNLSWLCEKFGRDAVSKRLGYRDNNYLSVLLSKNSKTKIGKKVSAKIEKVFSEISTKIGWLNEPQWEESLNFQAKQLIDNMSPKNLDLAIKLLQVLSENQN